MDVDDEHIARACAHTMLADDTTFRSLGFALEEVGPGRARVAGTVTEMMANGHGICHGGMIFTLADCAFAYACNSYNQRAVAQVCAITFLAPARIGDRLTAVAREQHRGARNGVYDITVTDQHGTVIAEFRGNSRVVSGDWLSDSKDKD
ncbi:MAG: hydroxyphenylacetyl-CoA thioesterase PaaI [Hyphomicrobiales bacterium]|nr:hydroxyphenylacetyl-CoA thioesterase PaaI [Hyphomicrobiales bacterium]